MTVPPAEWAQNIAAMSPFMSLAGVVLGAVLAFRLNARKSDAAWVLTKGFETFVNYKEAVLHHRDETVDLDNQIEVAHTGKHISTTDGPSTVLKAYRDVKHLGETLTFLFRDEHISKAVHRIEATSMKVDVWAMGHIIRHTENETWHEPRDLHAWYDNHTAPSNDILATLTELEKYIQNAYYPRPARRRRRIRSPLVGDCPDFP